MFGISGNEEERINSSTGAAIMFDISGNEEERINSSMGAGMCGNIFQ